MKSKYLLLVPVLCLLPVIFGAFNGGRTNVFRLDDIHPQIENYEQLTSLPAGADIPIETTQYSFWGMPVDLDWTWYDDSHVAAVDENDILHTYQDGYVEVGYDWNFPYQSPQFVFWRLLDPWSDLSKPLIYNYIPVNVSTPEIS